MKHSNNISANKMEKTIQMKNNVLKYLFIQFGKILFGLIMFLMCTSLLIDFFQSDDIYVIDWVLLFINSGLCVTFIIYIIGEFEFIPYHINEYFLITSLIRQNKTHEEYLKEFEDNLDDFNWTDLKK